MNLKPFDPFQSSTTVNHHCAGQPNLVNLTEHYKVKMTKTTIVRDEFKFDLGDQVGLLSHPFVSEFTNTKIMAYHHFTPPVMVVVEKHQKSTYDTATGKRKKTYKCLYYATVLGKFEEDWFQETQLKLVAGKEDDFYEQDKEKSLATLRKGLIGQQVILTTVDLELGKKKLFRSDARSGKLKENTLLDFLPPLGSVIQVSSVEHYQEFDKNTGEETHLKSKLKLKIRWFNNKTSKYSEEEIPMVALKKVELSQPLEFNDKNDIFLFDEEMGLEDNNDVKVVKQPFRYEDTFFKHYYYEYSFRNLLTGDRLSKCFDDQKSLDSKRINDESIGQLFQNWLSNKRFGFDEEIKKYKSAKIHKWYKIIYADQKGNYTVRLIYAREMIEGASETGHNFLEANCLLRKGAIRHFRLDRVLAYEKLSEESIKLFVVEGV